MQENPQLSPTVPPGIKSVSIDTSATWSQRTTEKGGYVDSTVASGLILREGAGMLVLQ